MEHVHQQIDFLRKGTGLAAIGLRISPERCKTCLDIIENFPDANLETVKKLFQMMKTTGIHASPKNGEIALGEVDRLRNDMVRRYGPGKPQTMYEIDEIAPAADAPTA